MKAESAFAAPLTVEQQVSLRQVQLAAAQEQPEQPPARAYAEAAVLRPEPEQPVLPRAALPERQASLRRELPAQGQEGQPQLVAKPASCGRSWLPLP